MLLATIETTASGSELASWRPLTMLLFLFGAVLVTLLATSRSEPLLRRIPTGLERVTHVPGWAAATVGTALFGLLVAGQGFYSDVAWHVALGRDDALFTAPHTAIFLGLQFIFASAAVAVFFATMTRVETRWRIGALRVPVSALPLAALGTAAVAGFPLDEVWHQAYGIDVTMWSPTHMLMILGATFTGMAAWLVLAEAGVPAAGRWGKGIHVAAAALTLQGLSAPLGEFSFGVPQFQQLFHPVLLCVAAGFALVVTRIVLGRGWAFGMTLISFVLLTDSFRSGGTGSDGPVDTRSAGIFVGSALAVELIAWLLGTERRLRFALVSGAGIGTIGLASEWLWNQGAYQPWRMSLLPEAIVLGVIGAIAAAVAGVAFVRVFGQGERIPRSVVAVAGLAVLAVILLPMPRSVGDVQAAVSIERVSDELAHLDVVVTPPDAADDARWFQATAWQGGGLVLSDFDEVEPGHFRTTDPVPVSERWKTLVRLHRGGELMTVPVYLPADPEIDEPEVPAIDRAGPFESETTYLLRETHPGDEWLKWVVYGLLVAAAAGWVVAFTVAVAKLGDRSDDGDGQARARARARRSKTSVTPVAV